MHLPKSKALEVQASKDNSKEAIFMVRTMTRTKVKGPEIQVDVGVDVIPAKIPAQKPVIVPTEQEIIAQLTEHFKGSIPEQEIKELAEIISAEFVQLKDLPYGDSHPLSKFAVYDRPKPELVITVYTDGAELIKHEFYPADYSTVKKLYHNHKTITVVTAVKRIQLAYVKR